MKFLDTVNKREYVRVCSRKPRCKPMNSLRCAMSTDVGQLFLINNIALQWCNSLFCHPGVFR